MEQIAVKGKRVARLDSVSLNQTYFTEEGYLVDHPVLTSCGIFEYHKEDGSIRRELRIPQYVFEAESLKSYKGKPVIITHNAGYVSTQNVSDEIVGTIISDGYKDGQDVRAHIIIHDVEKVKTSGMRELSLGYDLDLIEQAGEYNGEPYDAIQTNIRINHLALVKQARAGDQAHLNMDGKDMSNDKSILTGGKKEMSKITHKDAAMSPEDFAASVEAYKKAKAEQQGTPAPSEAPAPAEPTKDAVAEPASAEQPVESAPVENTEPTPEEKPVEDSAQEPGQPADATAVLGQLKQTVQALATGIEQLNAVFDMAKGAEPVQKDAEDEPAPAATEEGKQEPKPMNMDSVDAIVSQKLELAKIGEKLHLDGLETMDMKEAKKKVILTVRPAMNLDGVSDAYIDAAFDISKEMVDERKNTNDQRRQMAKGQRLDGMGDEAKGPSCSASDARQRMIERREKRGGNE